MKTALAALTLLAGAVSGYSQGQVVYSDYLKSDFQITIWQAQPGHAEVQGNSSAALAASVGGAADIPAGTTPYYGIPLGGVGADNTVHPRILGTALFGRLNSLPEPGLWLRLAGCRPLLGQL